MEQNQYYVLVRVKDHPAALVTKVIINSDNQHNAYQLAEAQYGNLLVSKSAAPIPYDWR